MQATWNFISHPKVEFLLEANLLTLRFPFGTTLVLRIEVWNDSRNLELNKSLFPQPTLFNALMFVSHFFLMMVCLKSLKTKVTQGNTRPSRVTKTFLS